MLEIELKVRVDALGPVRQRLQQFNAESFGRVHEHDIYYNAPHRNFASTDEALRVRYADGKAVVTYKGARIKNLGLKAREELNTAVESGEVFGEIGLLRESPRTATVTGLQPGLLLALERDAFLELVSADARLGSRLLDLNRGSTATELRSESIAVSPS